MSAGGIGAGTGVGVVAGAAAGVGALAVSTFLLVEHELKNATSTKK